MRKNLDFIKELLSIFESTETAFIDHHNILNHFSYYDMGSEIQDEWFSKYFYHLSLLYDANCIVTIGKEPFNMGITVSASGDFLMFSVKMRLTDNGHNVLIALNDDSIWQRLKNFSGGITTTVLIEAGKQATATGLAKLFN